MTREKLRYDKNMNRKAKSFLIGFTIGVMLIGIGTPFIFEIPAIGAYLHTLAQTLGSPGVLVSLPLHNLIQHPVWAVGCIATANGIIYGLIFMGVARLQTLT